MTVLAAGIYTLSLAPDSPLPREESSDIYTDPTVATAKTATNFLKLKWAGTKRPFQRGKLDTKTTNYLELKKLKLIVGS